MVKEIVVHVTKQSSNVNNAFVSIWIYNSNGQYAGNGRYTGYTGSNGLFSFTEVPDTSHYCIVNAWANGCYNVSNDVLYLTGSTETLTVQRDLSKNSDGYPFTISRLINYDTLLHYIGHDVSVLPVKVTIKDENGNIIGGYQDVTINDGSSVHFNGNCNTQNLHVYVTPTGSVLNMYDSAITSLDLFSYIGGNFGTLKTLTPRKEYTIERPLVYDTRNFNYDAGETLSYDLPNTTIEIKYNRWGSYTYYDTATSNESAITFYNNLITTSDVNHNFFYYCLAGYGGGNSFDLILLTLKKHHYNDLLYSSFAISAVGLTTAYTPSDGTVDYLYFCKRGENSLPLPNFVYAFTLQREENAVFRQNEVVDYVRGFGYTYYGNGMGRDIITPDRANINFSGFTLPTPEKCPPSKAYFYKAATENLGTGEGNSLQEFKSDFIDSLVNSEFITKYTIPASLETAYTENNCHCYVMEESIIPSGISAVDYLYFQNENYLPSLEEIGEGLGISPASTEASKFRQFLDDEIEKGVYVKLDRYGSDANLLPQFYNKFALKYSYNNLPWANYEIGTEIRIPQGVNVRFRAESQNEKFSSGENAYYKFTVTHNYHATYGTYLDIFNSLSPDAIGYKVYLGGKLSSLLTATTSVDATLNNYGFCNLFRDIEVTNFDGNFGSIRRHLDLDLLNVPSYGYLNMLANTKKVRGPNGYLYKKNGPEINAETVGTYAMAYMFCGSTVHNLKKRTLKPLTASNYCYYRMFPFSKFQGELSIEAITGGNRSYAEMFSGCSNFNSQCTMDIKTEVYNYQCAYNMFAHSNLHRCPNFATISSIGTRGFYQAFYRSRIDSLNFTVTGSVGISGCMRMCKDVLNSRGPVISEMNLEAQTLGNCCYNQMFHHSSGTNGTFNFSIPESIPVSGCQYMFFRAGSVMDVTYSDGAYGYYNNIIICPILSPTALSNACYSWMFTEAGINIAPELPATTLYEECYSHMFQGTPVYYHYEQNIEENVFNQGDFVINTTVIPKRACEYMYAWSKIYRVSNIISSGVTTIGPSGCGHMFYNTPLKVTNRARKIVDSNGNDLVISTWGGDGSAEGYSKFVDHGDGDMFIHINKSIWIGRIGSGSQKDINLLTRMTVRKDGQTYEVKENRESCTELFNAYIEEVTSGYKIHGVTGFTDGAPEFKYLAGTFNGSPTVSHDERWTTKIGTYAEYSTEEGSGLNSGYHYETAEEYVYLTANKLSNCCYEYMFANCYNLINGNRFLFGYVQSAERSFSHMFEGCNNLCTITPDLLKIGTSVYGMEYMYAGCSQRINWDNKYLIWEGWSWNNIGIEIGLHTICDNSEYITKYDVLQGHENEGTPGTTGYKYHGHNTYEPWALYAPNTGAPYHHRDGIYTEHTYDNQVVYSIDLPSAEGCYYHMFENCRALRTAKINLNTNSITTACFDGMFKGDFNLWNGPKLGEATTTVAPWCFHSMFEGCCNFSGKVSGNNKLTANNLAEGCYAAMFKGCGSMSAGPYLPATIMVNQCYNEMFSSAYFFKVNIKYKVKLHLIDLDTNGTSTKWMYYGVSGTPEQIRIFYALGLFSDADTYVVDTYQSRTESNAINITINDVQAITKTWWNPDSIYFNTHRDEAAIDVRDKLLEVFNNKVIYCDGLFGTGLDAWYRVTSSEDLQYIGGNTTLIDHKFMKYLNTRIPKASIGYPYTYEWVSGLGNFPNDKGDYYGPNASSTEYGNDAIPDGWERHDI